MTDLKERYFKWMCRKVGADLRRYEKLLRCLHSIPFNYIINMDGNRESDGIDLRYQFGYERNIDHASISFYLDHEPCSVLEMMAALAIRCESSVDTDIIEKPVKTLFEHMIFNLGLDEMYNDEYDEERVRKIVDRFINRTYKKDGNGGLFYIPDCDCDMREIEIWFQAMWYINYIMEEGEYDGKNA